MISEIPPKVLEIANSLLVSGESVVDSFRESFDWNIIDTWVILTESRIILIDSLPWRADFSEFDLAGTTLEFSIDDIGPYDLLQFISAGKPLFEISILRKRREEAESFIKNVSDQIAKAASGGDEEKDSKKKEENSGKMTQCDKYLLALKLSGAITEEEYEQEKKSQNECKKQGKS